MSDYLTQLVENPQAVFSGDIKPENLLKDVKTLLDPVTAENSVLDEIHVDGLVSSQVWGQVKLLIDGVNENILFGKIPEIKDKFGDFESNGTESEGEQDQSGESASELDESHDENSEEEEEEEEGYEDANSKLEATLDSDDSDAEFYNAVEDIDEAEDKEEIPEKDKFGLNDRFFSIDKFNKVTEENEENDEYTNDEQEVDLLADTIEGEEEEEDLMYNDFFKGQKGDNNDEEENDEEDEDDEQLELNDPDLEVAPEKDAFGLNDEVFSIDDFNKQVIYMEDHDDFNEEPSDDDEEIDLFADMSDGDDDEEEMLHHDDFFKKQVSRAEAQKVAKKNNKGKKVKFNSNNETREFNEDDYDDAYESAMKDFADDYDDQEVAQEEDIEEVDESKLSTFERQQRQIQREIAELEKESISEKKWTLKGEATAKSRSSDALLEEDLQFDRTAKPVPVITQEISESIEDIIKRRIIAEQFDEIPKRIITDISNFKPSKKVEVSEEKSAQSLAELYEDEFNDRDRQAEAMNEELVQAHNEITELFTSLNHKLDSLCSAHFIPKPKQKIMDIKVQTSTINMEDAQPLTMSTGETLAPQEIYKTGQKISKDEVKLRSGVVMSKEELDRSDKQRLRRQRKRKIHNHMKEKADKKKKVSKSAL